MALGAIETKLARMAVTAIRSTYFLRSNTMNLADTLAAHVQHLEANRPNTARAYADMVERLLAADAGRAAPGVGDQLPPFHLPDDRGRLTTSGELIAKGPLVVSLNRGHWCAFCRYELESLQAIHQAIVARGGSIIAITPERQAFAKQLRRRCSLDFPVLCDVDNGYALSLGLVVWCGEEIKSILTGVNFDLSVFQGNPGWMVPIPATYVVSTDGRIKASFVNPDFRHRMSPEDIHATLSS